MAAPSGPPQPVASGVSGVGLRVALFLADLRGGGAERMMVALANGLCRRGCEVDLLVVDLAGPYLDEVEGGVRLVKLGRRRVASAIVPLARYLRAKRPHALISTLTHANLVALTAKRLAGGPTRVVVREANTPVASQAHDLKSRVMRMMINRAYRHADGVVAVSEGVARALQTVAGLTPQQVTTLYNPVVSRRLQVAAAEPVDHPWLATPEAPVILSVASLTAKKDLATLLRAFARLVEDTDARLLVLGEGPERGELERQRAELGLADKVDLPGFDPNPFRYMARADLFVLSSRVEGLPGALIQALACGCPVVSTDCPSGPREILDDGLYGELVPVGDAAAMAEAMARSLREPASGELLRTRGARFDEDTVLDEYLGYLWSLAPRDGASGGR